MSEVEVITRCPYCMAPTDSMPLERRLTHRQYTVYRAVMSAGPAGVSTKELLETSIPGRSPGTLRTCVYGINKIIGPMFLKGKGGRYYLDRHWTEGETKTE